MADRYDKLAPRDLLITLRSLPRRLGSALAPAKQDSQAWAKRDRPLSDGLSLTDHVVNLGLSLAALEAEVSKMVTHTSPTIWSQVMSEDVPEQPDGPPLGTEAGEELAAGSAEAIAALLDHESGDEWARSAPLTGGGTVSTLQLGQQAARTAIESLRAIERAAGSL